MDWSCTGEQSALSVPHRPLMVVVGLQGAHTCSGGTTGCPHLQWWDYRVPTPAVGGGTVSTPASSLPRAPGDCTAPARCACLVSYDALRKWP